MEQNYLIHQLYVRQVSSHRQELHHLINKISNTFTPLGSMLSQQYEECTSLIDSILTSTNGSSEYALSVKALIQRQRGENRCSGMCWMHRHGVDAATLAIQYADWQVLCTISQQKTCIAVDDMQLCSLASCALPPSF
jgi:hypothetical protein